MKSPGRKVHPAHDFQCVSRRALGRISFLVSKWLPDGRQLGAEWIARNPTRDDRRSGSFKVNMRSGRWADFATGDRGGDLISLFAYLHRVSQLDALRQIEMELRHERA
jgi:hypothetical protein